MNSNSQKVILLVLMMSAALMSAPGLSRSIAKAQLHDTEAPSQSVEKFEFFEVGLVRQNRRVRFEAPCKSELIRIRLNQHDGELRLVQARHLFRTLAWCGHRLPNGLLAPLRI